MRVEHLTWICHHGSWGKISEGYCKDWDKCCWHNVEGVDVYERVWTGLTYDEETIRSWDRESLKLKRKRTGRS